MADNQEKKILVFEAEQQRTEKRILNSLQPIEMNIIYDLYKNPDLIENIPFKTKDFTSEMSRTYFSIIHNLVKEQKKKEVNEYVIGIYLENNQILKAQYEKYHGYRIIKDMGKMIREENFDSYIDDMKKWLFALSLNKKGFPIGRYLSKISNNSVSYLHDLFEASLNDTFLMVDQDIKSYNVFDGMNSFIDELNDGDEVGIPFHNAELLTAETGGWNINGNIYGLGSLSGVGKSTMVFNYLVPSVMKLKERIVFIINEEDEKKMKRELLVWVANNFVLKNSKNKIHKYHLRVGHFSEEMLKVLREAAKLIEDLKNRNIFTVIPLDHYSVNTVVKIIKKYNAAFGVRMFVLDTLKESFDAKSDEIYKSMMRDMVTLYDTVKPSKLNVGLFVTYQLGKSSARVSYLTNNEIGQAKSIIDVMSVNFMMRRPSMKEVEELHGYTFEGESGNTKMINKKMDPNKKYMITFITKNRFGATNERQIVSECDLGTNMHKDVFYCNITEDW